MFDPRRGTVLAGRYELLERVGAGGSATVYRALDLPEGRDVALKVLHQVLNDDEVAIERFRREARCLERLRHPNIVHTYGHGVSDGAHYIAMEHVPGRSLKSVVASEGPLESSSAIEIVLQVLEAARFIHTRGILHRDLKPANVIVDSSGIVKVTDFGIACRRAHRVTSRGSLVGTMEYVSPERLKGEAPTESCDVYSIGVMLYEMVTGQPPFAGDLVSTVALKHLREPPVPPNRRNRTVSSALAAIILRALEKAPEDRFRDAGAFALALRREARRPVARRRLAAAV